MFLNTFTDSFCKPLVNQIHSPGKQGYLKEISDSIQDKSH